MSTQGGPEGFPPDPEKIKILQTGIVRVAEEVHEFNAEELRGDLSLAMSNGRSEIQVDFSQTAGIQNIGFAVLVKMAERGRLDESDIKTLRIINANERLYQLMGEIHLAKAGISIAPPLLPEDFRY